MIILVNGLKRSGKDTFAAIMKELIPQAEVHAFAEPLKEITAKSFGLPLDVIEKLKNDESVKIGFRSPNEKMCTGNSMRNFLQNLGTEAMKPIFGDDVWATLLLKKYLNSPKGTIFIVPDFRVIEEYTTLTSTPITANLDKVELVTLSISRDVVQNSGDCHVTEQGIKDFVFDWEVDNNGSLDDLRAEAIDFLDYVVRR